MTSMKIHQFGERDLVDLPLADGFTVQLAQYIRHPNMAAGFVRLKRRRAIARLAVLVRRSDVRHERPCDARSLSPYTSGESHNIKEGDLFYIPRSSKVSIQTQDESFDALYVTYPDPEDGTEA